MNREQTLAIAYAVIALSGGAIEQSIPDTARWIAQDWTGNWYAYANKPGANFLSWTVPYDKHRLSSASSDVYVVGLATGKTPKDFTQTLYEI